MILIVTLITLTHYTALEQQCRYNRMVLGVIMS